MSNSNSKKVMKPVPITLSAKKASFKQEAGFTPYKIEWKNIAPETSKNNHSNKQFFHEMKNELSNIKSDVEKMMKKENKKTEVTEIFLNKVPLRERSLNVHHRRSDSNESKKFIQIMRPEKETQVKNQETRDLTDGTLEAESFKISDADFKALQKQVQQLNNETRIQKSLISQLKTQNQTFHNEIESKSAIISRLEQSQESKTHFYENQKQKTDLLAQQNERLKEENEEVKRHNTYLEENMETFNNKMEILAEEIAMKDEEICKYQKTVTDLQQKMKEIINKPQRTEIFEKEYSALQEESEKKMKEIIDKFQKEKLQIIEQKMEQLKRIEQNKEKETNLTTIVKDDDRMRELGVQFEQKVNLLLEQNYCLKNNLSKLQSEVEKFTVEKDCLEKQIQILLDRDYEMKNNKSLSTNDYERMIEEIESLKEEKEKMAEDYEYKIMKLENTIDSLKIVKSTKITRTNGQQIIEECDNLPSARNSQRSGDQNFNKILKSQLEENESLKNKMRDIGCEMMKLHERIKELEFIEESLKNELEVATVKLSITEKKVNTFESTSKYADQQTLNQIEEMKYNIQILKKRQETSNSVIDSKNKQIKSKDEFIQKVMISKTDKAEEKAQIQYLIEKLREFSQKTTQIL